MSDLRDLEVRHLLTFDTVVTTGTFGRAATQLGYTQSAVSQQIAALEKMIGGKLFDRPGGPRPPELTALGRRLLGTARELLARVDAMEIDLRRFVTGETGLITVGTFQSISATLLPLVLGRMRASHPDVEVRVFEADEDDLLLGALARGELDVSFYVGRLPEPFETVHLLDDPFVLLARPGQFPDGPTSLTRIAREPMVGQHHNSCQLMNEEGLRAAGLAPNYVFRSNDNGTVAAMVRAGMGVAVLPLLCVDPGDRRITLHPIDPEMPDREIMIAWRADRTLAPAARHFVDLSIEVAVELEPELHLP